MENKIEKRGGKLTWGGVGLRMVIAAAVVFLAEEGYQKFQTPNSTEGIIGGYKPTDTKPAETLSVTDTPQPSETSTKEKNTPINVATRTRIPRPTNTFRPRESKTNSPVPTRTDTVIPTNTLTNTSEAKTSTPRPTVTRTFSLTAELSKTNEDKSPTVINTTTLTRSPTVSPSFTATEIARATATVGEKSTINPVSTPTRQEVVGTLAVTGANENPNNLYENDGLINMRALVAAAEAGLLTFVWEERKGGRFRKL